MRGGNFDAGTRITINDKEAMTEFVSPNELNFDFPPGKFGSLIGAKAQAVDSDERKTNILAS